MIVRLASLLVAGCAFTVLLGMAAATAPLADREYSDFRACIATIPHPALPAELLTRGDAAQKRALALLGAEDACARVSGIDGSGRVRPLEWLHARRPGGSERNAAVDFFATCSGERRLSRGFLTQAGVGIDCFRHSGGLSATQFELATGFDPQFDLLKIQKKDEPILSKHRFPHAMAHARDGTWWSHSCS